MTLHNRLYQAARRAVRIPDAITRSLGPNSRPLWYAGALQTDEHDVGTVPVPPDIDPATLRAAPRYDRPNGEQPDDALAAER